MAFSSKISFALLVSLSLLLPSALGAGVECEDLPKDLCSFAVSSESKRCVLESSPQRGGGVKYQCRTSGVKVDRMSNYVETDYCVNECGVRRNTVGISSDSLLEPNFIAKLCSLNCHENCPNIVDLYFNLAAGEGVFLPDLCEAQRLNPRRAMAEVLSSGGVAQGPVSGSLVSSSLAPSPASF